VSAAEQRPVGQARPPAVDPVDEVVGVGLPPI
jgi:hypothetical protein